MLSVYCLSLHSQRISLKIEFLSVAPWLWGCSSRVAEKYAASLGEVSQGKNPRHRKEETDLWPESESVAELRVGSRFLTTQLIPFLLTASSLSFMHSDIHSLAPLFIQHLLEKDKESCYGFCDTCFYSKFQDPIELKLERLLTEANEAQGSEIIFLLLYS